MRFLKQANKYRLNRIDNLTDQIPRFVDVTGMLLGRQNPCGSGVMPSTRGAPPKVVNATAWQVAVVRLGKRRVEHRVLAYRHGEGII